VKLKRLILQGFKSFKDRTVIHFDEGITGIVGPNGCGKSNVVDAPFWVMGEQSAKHLRGATMKDVIFAGSSKYTPAAFAEVSLVLENDEGKHIHIGHQVSSPTEIQLTRKLYRNGETEYRINDVPCRLRDIQEVFMDTGAGAKSYSIIAQGEIHRLVNQKPEERRVMIEEVAGITKFKVRKKESLKKIEQTEQNLARLNDLQQEIEKNLKALEKQAEKAERARDLKQKVEKYDLVVHSHKEFELLKNFKESKTIVDARSEEIDNISMKKSFLEKMKKLQKSKNFKKNTIVFPKNWPALKSV
jgi:chromosome segregation protein